MNNNEILRQLESEQRQNLLAQHLFQCIRHGTMPDPYKIAPEARELCRNYIEYYDAHVAPPDQRIMFNGRVLQASIQRMLADATVHPDILIGAQHAYDMLVMVRNVGFPFYATDMWYLRTWLAIRSEEALRKEGEFI